MAVKQSFWNSLKHPLFLAAVTGVSGLLLNTYILSRTERHSLQLEEMKDRREVVLSLLQQGDAQQTIEKLQLLSKSGLLDDPDRRLQRAVASTRIKMPCNVSLAGPPPRVGKELTGDARIDSAILANQLLAYQRYTETLRTILESCGATFREAAKPSTERP